MFARVWCPYFVLFRCQYLYFCTNKASKVVCDVCARLVSVFVLFRCQYLYFCTRKANNVGVCDVCERLVSVFLLFMCHYLYFCTSKASKVSTCASKSSGGSALTTLASALKRASSRSPIR
jgi:hypothetical protein